MTDKKPNIKQNLAEIKKNIAAASRGVPVKLVAVTKQATVEQMRELLLLGVDAIGENRVLEAADKFTHLSEFKFEKHLIGHLQTNKVASAVRVFDVIQSVDSLKLATAINDEARKLGKVMPVFIEVNISGEETKYGVAYDDAFYLYTKMFKLTNLKAEGLMTIAPLFNEAEIEKVRPYFKKMFTLSERMKLKWLSMGMSNDYRIAIEEGSNMVRIGSALFN